MGTYAIEVAGHRLLCQGMTRRPANRITPSSWCLKRKCRLPGLEPEVLGPNLKLLAEEFGPLGQTFLKKTCHGRRWDEAARAKSKKVCHPGHHAQAFKLAKDNLSPLSRT